MFAVATACAVAAAANGCVSGGPSEREMAAMGVERLAYRVELAGIGEGGGVGDAEVSYLVREGETPGPTLVYIHGTPGDATNFVRYLRTPVKGLASIAVDRPGFGESWAGSAVVSMETQAKALLPLIDEAPGRVVLIGHSLGAPIAAWASALRPERVVGLVLLAGSLDPELEELKWYNHAAGLPGLSALLPRSIRHSNDEVRAAREETRHLAQVLGEVACPVVVVHGVRDSLVPVANAEYAKRTLTGVRRLDLVILERAGHLLPWRNEATVRQAIATVLEPDEADCGPHRWAAGASSQRVMQGRGEGDRRDSNPRPPGPQPGALTN
jgi:pimeloyl-ACP methyl ester carboxylesterase